MLITVVFEAGDDFKKVNPFKIESAFGKAITISLGDKIAELDVLEEKMLEFTSQDGRDP